MPFRKLITGFAFGVMASSAMAQYNYVIEPGSSFVRDFTKGIDVCQEVFPTNNIDDCNDDKCKWKYDLGWCYEYNHDGVTAADDDLISKDFIFKKGHEYLFELGICCEGAQYPERIEAYIKEIGNPDGDRKTFIIERTDVTWRDLKVLSGTYYVDPSSNCTHRIVVHACSDPDMNKLYFKTLAITDLGLVEVEEAELAVSGVEFAGGDAMAGYKNTVVATVTNNGTKDSDAFTVTFDFNNENTQSAACQPLKAGESVTVTADYSPTLFEQEYNLAVYIDDTNADTSSQSANLTGVLARPPHPAPRITEVTQPIRYQAIIRWEMPQQDQTMALADYDQPGNLVGYNIYRNKARIGYMNAGATSYLDSNTSAVESAEYHVVAIYENGVSDISNPMKIDVKTGVNDVACSSPEAFVIEQNGIVFKSECTASIADTLGRTVMHNINVQNGEYVPLPTGLYILTINGKAYKVRID